MSITVTTGQCPLCPASFDTSVEYREHLADAHDLHDDEGAQVLLVAEYQAWIEVGSATSDEATEPSAADVPTRPDTAEPSTRTNGSSTRTGSLRRLLRRRRPTHSPSTPSCEAVASDAAPAVESSGAAADVVETEPQPDTPLAVEAPASPEVTSPVRRESHAPAATAPASALAPAPESAPTSATVDARSGVPRSADVITRPPVRRSRAWGAAMRELLAEIDDVEVAAESSNAEAPVDTRSATALAPRGEPGAIERLERRTVASVTPLLDAVDAAEEHLVEALQRHTA